MDISVIIVNYDSKEFVLECIKSIKLADFGNLSYEIIVVDNDLEDGIGEALKQNYSEIVFIQNKKNTGMGPGNNVGIKKAKGKFIAICNPDIVVFKDTFIKLYNFLKSRVEVGIVGPRQLNLDKSVQASCYRWHSLMTPIYRRTFLGDFKFAQKDYSPWHRLYQLQVTHKNI